MKYFFVLLLLLSNFSYAQETLKSPAVDITEEDDFSDDELEEDDPMAEELSDDDFTDDPMAQEDSIDPLEDDESDSQTQAYPKVKTKNDYRTALGYKDVLQRGFATGSNSERERKFAVVNAFDFYTKVSYSDDVSSVVNLNMTFLQEYDLVQSRYTDNGNLMVNESYVNVDRGDYNYRLGAIKVTNGPLDLNSPSNVLTMGNALAFNSFDIKNLTRPFIGGQYSKVGESSTLIFTASVLKPQTAGSEYTRYLEESEQRNKNENIKDYSELGANAGLRLLYNFSAFNLGLSAFYWFDTDTQIAWTDTTESTATIPDSYSDTYTEKITNTTFFGGDFDMNIGSFVLKSELYYFQDKNVYSYLTNSDNEKVFTTENLNMFSSAVSLEKISGDLFIMGVYSYKKLFDVPENTNILGFENPNTLSVSIRNLEFHQVSLVANYTISDSFKFLFSVSQAIIVSKTSIVSALDYKLSDDKTLGLKAIYLDAEEHLLTSSKLNTKQIFVDYTYQF